jgi:hypothetical protein
MNEPGKSDKPVVPMKPASGGPRQNFWEFVEQLQRVEGRGLAKENEDPVGNPTDEVFQVEDSKTNRSDTEPLRGRHGRPRRFVQRAGSGTAGSPHPCHPYPAQRLAVMIQGKSPVR